MNRSQSFHLSGLVVLVLAVAAQAAAPGTALGQQDGRPTVAVMDFSNGSLVKRADYEALTVGIADILISELQPNQAIRVVEREHVQRLLDEIKLNKTDLVDQATAVRAAKQLGVHHMIFGGFIVQPNGKTRLDARAVSVETGEIEHVESVTGKSDAVVDMITALAAKMNKGMKLPPMPERPPSTGQAQARPGRFQGVLLYSQALVALGKGNRTRAVELFKAALVQDPENRLAHERLKRAELGGG